MDARVIGIDFGASHVVSVVAGLHDSPGAIATRAAATVTPSAVYFGPGGQTLAGEEALDRAASDPDHTVLGLRDWLSDSGWKRKIDRKKRRGIDVVRPLFEHVARVLTCSGGPIELATLTVPAYAHDEFRGSARDAARAAGLPVARVLNEPSAAAVAYALTAGLTGTVLVYGLGFDLDVTVLRVESPAEIEVLGTDGERADASEGRGVDPGRTSAAIERALRCAQLNAGSVNAAILLGERALEPGVDEVLRGAVGRPPLLDILPAEVVARGAAMWAAAMCGERRAAA